MTASGTDSIINKVQYVEQDFSTFVDSIRNFISTNYPEDYNDYVNSQMGMMLVDIIAYASHCLCWNINRRATDLYFPTAVSPNAVAKISRMLGYKPSGATPAVATITVTLTGGPYSFPVRVVKGFQFKGPNDLIFEYRGDEAVTFSPGETVKTFDVKEGYSITENYLSSGDENQIFNLVNAPTTMYVADGDVTVKVNGVEWTEDDFIPYEAVQEYETDLISSPPSVKFGDSIQGQIPTTGYGIEIKYFVTNGFRGRIDSSGITGPTITTVVNSTSIPMSVSQPNPSFGGNDPESLSEIVTNAPRFQSTQDRAITKFDYDFLAGTFENVSRADAQIIRSVSSDYTINNLVDLINADLDQIVFWTESLSGYGIVSSYTASIVTEVSSTLTTVTGFTDIQDNITGFVTTEVNAIDAAMQTIADYTSACPTVSAELLALVSTVTGSTAAIETIYDSASGLGSVSGYVEIIQTDMASILSDCTTIDGLAADVADSFVITGYAYSVSGEVESLYNYLDTILSDGCRANTVQVSILGKDAERKFVAPSAATISDLQDYLDARKDAVHTVVVVAGTAKVIDVDILVEVALTVTAAEDDVMNRIEAALLKYDEEPLGLLVEREFNASLYLYDIYNAIDAVVDDDEVEYVNVIIQGPAEYLDSRGNLVIPDGFVIQRGSVTVAKVVWTI